MNKYTVEFDWVITQRGVITVDANSEDNALEKVDDMLRNKSNKDYEDPYRWLPEDTHPFLDIKKVDLIIEEQKCHE